MKRVVMLLAAASLSAAVVRAQTLANPSFEEQGEQADLASGWSRWGHWVNRENDWTPVRDGSCLMGYHHWQIESSDSSGFYQDVSNVVPGKVYSFSVYANADPSEDETSNADSVELRLETTLYGEQSIVVSKIYRFVDLATNGQWSLLRVRAAAPRDILRAVVILTPSKDAPRGGALKLDEAALSAE